jgi:hypothetical protein
MVGINAMLSSVRKGRLGVIVSRDKFKVDTVDEMLSDTSWCVSDPELWRKA